MILPAESGKGGGEGAVLSMDQPSRVISRDIELVRRARREGWLKNPSDMQRVASRVVSIALTSADESIAIKAAAELRQMVAQDLEQEGDTPPRHIEHHHTHEIGPVTAENIEQHKAIRLARLAGSV